MDESIEVPREFARANSPRRRKWRGPLGILLAWLFLVLTQVGCAPPVLAPLIFVRVVPTSPGYVNDQPVTSINVPRDAGYVQLNIVVENTSQNKTTDLTETSEITSDNVNIAYPVVPTSEVGGSKIPVPGAGCFLVGREGTTTITVRSQQITVNVQPPASIPLLFGNGSQGALEVNSDTNWIASGVPGGSFFPQFTSLTVKEGVKLTVPSGLNIRCSGPASIKGRIVVADWWGNSQTGLTGSYADKKLSQAEATSIVTPGFLGGGDTRESRSINGSVGSKGGGTFGLRAAQGITIGPKGQIVASPAAPRIASGGAGGGVVVLVWGKGSQLLNQGLPGIDCRGGAGGDALTQKNPPVGGGGGGGGGLIRLIGPGAAMPAATAATAIGGIAGKAVRDPRGAVDAYGTLGGPGNSSAGSASLRDQPGGDGLVVASNVTDPSTVVPAAP